MRLLIAAFGALVLGCAPSGPGWSAEHESSGAALLSVTSIGPRVVAVGADDGTGPAILLAEDGGVERIAAIDRGALWWSAPDLDGSLVVVGEHGRILRLWPESGALELVTSPTVATLYGVWVAENGLAFAVGGDPETGRGALLRRSGGRWQVEDEIDPALLDEVMLFKVWGRSASDVWIVGDGGTLLRFDGTRFSAVAAGTSTRLLTIHGSESEGPYAVGGAANGVLLEWLGDRFVDRMPAFMPAGNGVFVGDATAIAVGNQGLVLRRDATGAWNEETDLPSQADFHAVTVDAQGYVWIAGGNLLSPSLDGGVLLRSTR